MWSSEPQRAPLETKRGLFISANVPVRVSAPHPRLEDRNSAGFIPLFLWLYPHSWLLEHAHEVFVRAEIEGREEERLGKWRRGGRRRLILIA